MRGLILNLLAEKRFGELRLESFRNLTLLILHSPAGEVPQTPFLLCSDPSREGTRGRPLLKWIMTSRAIDPRFQRSRASRKSWMSSLSATQWTLSKMPCKRCQTDSSEYRPGNAAVNQSDLRTPKDSAGSIMTTEYVDLKSR